MIPPLRKRNPNTLEPVLFLISVFQDPLVKRRRAYDEFLIDDSFSSDNFSTLLKRCTIAVMEIATSIGKKRANTGINSVPRPNPEKNVTPAAIKAVMHKTAPSIG